MQLFLHIHGGLILSFPSNIKILKIKAIGGKLWSLYSVIWKYSYYHSVVMCEIVRGEYLSNKGKFHTFILPVFSLCLKWDRGSLLFSHWVTSDSFVTPWTIAHQAPLSMIFARQEYWSGLPFSSPGDLPNPGGKPCIGRPAFYHWATGEAT